MEKYGMESTVELARINAQIVMIYKEIFIF